MVDLMRGLTKNYCYVDGTAVYMTQDIGTANQRVVDYPS